MASSMMPNQSSGSGGFLPHMLGPQTHHSMHSHTSHHAAQSQALGQVPHLSHTATLQTGVGGQAQASQYEIREVWAGNLEEEMTHMRELVQHYNYVAMDTEFPGVVARPIGSFRSTADYHYQTLRCNVDLLKIIQLGLTFSDSEGGFPPLCCTWQFNFRFNLNEDMYAQDSIDLLTRSGIEFKKNEDYGIDVNEFAELLMTSGIVLNSHIKWISFHSGYDFGYLLKLLTCTPLPAEESDFFELVRLYFPCVYDIKYLMKSCKNLKGGLNDLADGLEIQRIGPQHQAGSDSLLTSATFFKMRKMFFENQLDDQKYMGILYGLTSSYAQDPPRPGALPNGDKADKKDATPSSATPPPS
eukprot:TRINITY_DN6077_c0_g1_i2.p1 TRINITY_DN6077_c0_g1~~TRINITY_DN6077_c0_g1_i2.p1  ORF type:complete len:356 (-),score=71.79 TRINITY_DN6077_c0_g1_i2:38-1105(-)